MADDKNETLSTIGTIAGLGLVGLSISELLSNPDRYQEVFGEVAKDAKDVKAQLVRALKSPPKQYKLPPKQDMNRIDRLGQAINKRINPMIDTDLKRIEELSSKSLKWSLKADKILNNPDDVEFAKEALRRASRTSLNLPTLKMTIDDVNRAIEPLYQSTKLLEDVSDLLNRIEDKIPTHQRADFRRTFTSEFAKQKRFLKDGGDKLFDKNAMFEAWSKDPLSTRRIYKSDRVSIINGAPKGGIVAGINQILGKDTNSRLRNGIAGSTRLTKEEAASVMRNFEALQKIYPSHTNGRYFNYKLHVVTDDVRGGFAVMADISFRRIRFQLPLLANREADFGHERLSMTNAKGGITYEGNSGKLYQSATVVPAHLPDIRGEIKPVEEFMISEFNRTFDTLQKQAPNNRMTKVLDVELNRQKDIFLDRTINIGQRLIPNIKGTQAAVAVIAANQAIVTSKDFVLSRQEDILALGNNKNLKILDLAPSSFSGSDGTKVFQADAPTIDTQLLGFDPTGDDILPTDKTYSFRKTIELTAPTRKLGSGAVIEPLPSKPSVRETRAQILGIKPIDKAELAKQADAMHPTNKAERNKEYKRLLKEANQQEEAAMLSTGKRTPEEFKKLLQDKHEEVLEDWRGNRSFIEERNRLNPAISDADFIGYDMDNPNVIATKQNKKFLPTIYQDGILDAHFRLEYQMGEGLYMGKSYGFVSDASTIKNVSQVNEKWAAVWEEAKNKESMMIPVERLKSYGKTIGMNDAGNLMQLNLRGSHIKGIQISVNPTTGDFIYRTVYDKGDFSKGKSFGIKGQVKDTANEDIFRETAHALGGDLETGKKAAVNLLGRDGQAIISDMDQVVRSAQAMKEATIGGAAILLSNKDPGTWRWQVQNFFNNLNGKESIAEYSKRVFKMHEANEVNPELAGFNIRGAFNNSVMDPKLLGDEDASRAKWIETYGSSPYSIKAFEATRKQKGFFGGTTVSFDTPSELGGAGKMASVERRALHSMLANLEHAGVHVDDQALIMSDIMRRIDNSKMGNWKTTYETMNASFFSIHNPAYFNEKNLGSRIPNLVTTAVKLEEVMSALDDPQLKNSHLIELDLGESLAGKIMSSEHGTTKITIPGARGIPDMERVQIKKDKATVTMTEEYISARDNFLRTALDPNATEEQVTKELFDLRNQLALGTSETVRQNMSGKVAGSAQGRFLTLMDDQFIHKDGKYHSSAYHNHMKRLAAADKYQSVFVRDAVFLQQVKGLKSSSTHFEAAIKEDTKKMAREHIRNFFFRKGEGYNTGFFSRNPTLSEGHGILTKQRRYLEDNVNSVLLSNRKVRSLLTLMSGKERASEAERKKILIKMLNEDHNPFVEITDNGVKKSVKAQDLLTDIIYQDVNELQRRSLSEKGASIYTAMSKDKLTYKLSTDGGKTFKDETSKKLFYSRAFRAIGDSDGDVVSMLLGGTTETDAAMTKAIKDGEYASKMFRADIEFDTMNKRIGMTQAQNLAGAVEETLTHSERVTSFIKTIFAKNVGQYSIAIDTLKSGIMAKEGVDPIRRRQLFDLLLAIEENMLKAKKIKGKLENFGDAFAAAVLNREDSVGGGYKAYQELLEKRVAKFADVDVVEIGGTKHTLNYGELFKELWDAKQAFVANGGRSARSLKDVSNKLKHDDALTYLKGDRIAAHLQALNEGRGSLINAAAVEADVEIGPVSASAATADPRASEAGSKVLAGNAATAIDNASTATGKPLKQSLMDRVFNKETIRWATENRGGLAMVGGIAGIGLAFASIKGSQGQQSEPIIENPFRERAVIPRDQIMQPETYIQMDTGRANVELAGLQSLPGVSNALASSGIRKQALVLSDNRPPITKSYVDKRER